VGQVTITATSNNNITATALVYVHEKVDQVGVGLPACTTMGQPVGIYGAAYSTSAQGCSVASPCNITSTVGPFTFGSNDTSVVAGNADGGLTAGIPGATTVFASVAGVNSVGTRYVTCPVAYILVHSPTDTNITSFTTNTGGTVPLVANVFDTNNQSIAPPIIWASSANAAATVAVSSTNNNAATVTALTPGTATITATCSYPACNKLLPAQYGLNVATVTVSGGTATTVYAASTNSTTLVPISTSTNQAGTAITLPNIPNSIIADPTGTNLYLGSTSGLMVVNVSTGAVSLEVLGGTAVAISPNGTYLTASSAAAGTIQYFNLATQVVDFTYSGTTTTAAYTPDSNTVATFNGNNLYSGSSIAAPTTTPLTYTPAGLDISAQGGLIYLTGAGLIDLLSTCNPSDVQMLTANNPTLIKALPNGTGAVAADSPAIDVVSTPSPLALGCPIATPSSIANFDLGAGAFSAQQLIMSPDSSHAFIISDLPQLLSFYLPTTAPTAIPYIGGATAYSGGVTSDSTQVYVGASDGTVHRIAVASNADVQQISVGLKDANGNFTVPNLVYVVP
jgi:WD40 repeat protein